MLQNKALRIISHAKYNASSAPLYKENHVLKLEDMYETSVCKLMNKIYHDNVPAAMMMLFKKYVDIHPHNTRHKDDFVHKTYRLYVCQQSFLVKGPILWSKLPQALKCNPHKRFGKCIKEHYIAKYLYYYFISRIILLFLSIKLSIDILICLQWVLQLVYTDTCTY